MDFNYQSIGIDKEKIKREHKTQLTTFELKQPECMIKNIQIPIQNSVSLPCGFWLNYKWKDFKTVPYLMLSYNKMKHNFCVETTYYDDNKGFDNIWILFHSTLKSGCEISNRFFPTGFVGVYFNDKDVKSIAIAWVHPYLRFQGNMKTLMEKFLVDSFFQVDPPITYSMECCVRAAAKNLTPEQLNQRLKFENEQFSKEYDIDISGFTNEKILLLKNFSSMVDNKEEMLRLVEIITDEVIQELKENAENCLKYDDNPMKTMNNINNLLYAKKKLNKK